VRLVADGDPAPLGELVPAALRSEPGAVTRGTGVAERGVPVVVQPLIADVHNAGVELHMSDRTLHRVFDESGQTVTEFIRSRRFDGILGDLRSPASAGEGIGRIAAR
jgi:hypothetical protein